MSADLTTLLLGFLEGFALILSPCVLSVLPILLAGSLAGSKKRSFGIIVGFIFFFAVLSFFARQLVYYSGIDLNWIRYGAYSALVLVACILLSNHLNLLFNRLTERIGRLAANAVPLFARGHGFFPGMVFGGLIALIWTPCAGPILAAIIVQIAIQKTTLLSFFTLLAFTAGVAVPILIIILYGFKIKNTFDWFKRHALLLRRGLGVIILFNVAYMIALESGLFYSALIKQTPVRTAQYLQQGLWRPYQAPKIEGISEWLNSPPLQLAALKGKVVLIDFWAYSCINCVRTIPHLNNWYKKYQDKGLVIIGIHSPEFDFEHLKTNVAAAVNRYKITYPVALDNTFSTWRNFANHYWPAHYLIDKNGTVVYEHFGEGAYDVTEHNIRFLLGLDEPNVPPLATVSSANLTPETYLGYGRAESQLSPELSHGQIKEYHASTPLAANAWGLDGRWLALADKMSSVQNNASITLDFTARTVFAVMGSSGGTPLKVQVLLNGKLVDTLFVTQYTLYPLLNLPKKERGLLQLRADRPGLEVYTFTFGN